METAKGWAPEEETSQGAVISPLLSNLYLDPLDHEMEQRGAEMMRYRSQPVPPTPISAYPVAGHYTRMGHDEERRSGLF
jgi:hypothetical protein